MNCSVCKDTTLYHYLRENLSWDAVALRHQGVYYVDAASEEKFRECLDMFVATCNEERQTAEGYELCEDLDQRTGIVTFYVMREDGKCMLEFSAAFVGKTQS